VSSIAEATSKLPRLRPPAFAPELTNAKIVVPVIRYNMCGYHGRPAPTPLQISNELLRTFPGPPA
jgi:hypothetical protein